jgi:hypothetical protein
MSGANDMIPLDLLDPDLWDDFVAWGWGLRLPWPELKRMLFDWSRLTKTPLTGHQVEAALRGNHDHGP